MADIRAPLPDEPFRHGVASGDPMPDRVIIWTRVSVEDDAPDVRWTVARDEGLDDVVVTGTTRATGEHDHTVKIDVPGLDPATTYWYAFEVDGHRSPVGRTRTAPAGRCDHLRLAFTSCAKWTAGYYNTYARIADRDDLDVVLHLGDWFYEYENDPEHANDRVERRYIPDHRCITLEDYRDRHAQTRSDPATARMCARHPIVHVFDDHEFANDRWRDGAGGHKEATMGPWEERAAAALRAWWEWMPVRMPDPTHPRIIYRMLAFGDLVDLVMIDCRSFRDEQAVPPDMYDTQREVLGRDQHEWLIGHLARSTSVWRLVGNPIMVGQVHTQYLPEWLASELAELGMIAEKEHDPSPDQWDGYPAARDRLFADIRRHRVSDLVFLSGDVHTSWAVELKEQPTSEDVPLAVEFVSPSVTSENLDEEVGHDRREAGPDVEGAVMDDNPHVRWCELDEHGYVVLDVDRERIEARWWHVDTVLEESDGERMASAWEVRAGHPMLTHVDGAGGP